MLYKKYTRIIFFWLSHASCILLSSSMHNIKGRKMCVCVYVKNLFSFNINIHHVSCT